MPFARAVAVALALVVHAAAAAAQGAASGDPVRRPGEWKPLDASAAGSEAWLAPGMPAPAADVRAMQQRLRALVEVLHRVPTLAAPVGFVAWPRTEVGDGGDAVWKGARRWPVGGTAEARIVWHWVDQSTGAVQTHGRGEGAAFGLAVNDLRCIFDGDPVLADAEGPMYAAPAAPGREEGHAQFPRCTIVTARPAPPYVPVSRERVIRWHLRELPAQLTPMVESRALVPAAQRRSLDSTIARLQGQIAGLRRMLAAMSPAELAAPAVVTLDAGHPFAEPGSSSAAIALVEPNPRFFDLARPGAVQSIAVLRYAGASPDPTFGDRLRAELDWKALAGLVR